MQVMGGVLSAIPTYGPIKSCVFAMSAIMARMKEDVSCVDFLASRRRIIARNASSRRKTETDALKSSTLVQHEQIGFMRKRSTDFSSNNVELIDWIPVRKKGTWDDLYSATTRDVRVHAVYFRCLKMSRYGGKPQEDL
eukprot:gb/GECG01009588.1/.p1 GENE.gb/GECG01009588.1/~~gb/GECG01009588.1/.p1  ORF type:complete len:138 (+),score=9.62 gb/GECG01009588.1/:1-414(+)